MKKYLIILLLLILIPITSLAQEKVNIYVFHQYTCPHCKKALSYQAEILYKTLPQKVGKQININKQKYKNIRPMIMYIKCFT